MVFNTPWDGTPDDFSSLKTKFFTMKTTRFAARAALLGLTVISLLSACNPGPKTLDTVLKDVPADAYALNFEELQSNPVLTKSSYGSVPAGFMLDIDEICPPLKDFGYKRIPPIIVWPTLVPPKMTMIPPRTCPLYVPYSIKDVVLEQINKSNWQYAKDLTTVKAGDKAVFISKQTLAGYRGIQPDSMDMMGMKGVNLDDVFVMIPDLASAGMGRPGDTSGPSGDGSGTFFRRYWYGQRIKDIIIPPKYIGCFDKIQLGLLRENLVRYNKFKFDGLKVIDATNGNAATLSF